MTNRLFPLLLLIGSGLAGCASAPDPALFDAGLDNQSGLTFAPDGSTAYWVEWDGDWGSSAAGKRTIYFSVRSDVGWSSPEPMPFSSDASDDDPFVSPDGDWLYFVSARPDRDIWRYRLDGSRRLERLSINSPAAEYSPVVVSSGAMYFASARPEGPGQGDLYRAAPDGEAFGGPVVLGPEVNSLHGEWNLWVSADETVLIFEASGRPGNVSASGDLYYSLRIEEGWSPASPLEELNTSGSDLLPRMHPDGKTLFYTSAPIGGNARVTTARPRFDDR
jgi:hypothetical protein